MKTNLRRLTIALCAVLSAGMLASCQTENTITSPNGIRIPANETEVTTVIEDAPGEEQVEFVSGTYFSGSQRPTVVSDSQYLPEAPIDEAQSGKIVYTVNNDDAGYISGTTVQEAGKESVQVRAVANIGYKFVKWSDGVTETRRSADTEEGVYTAIFDYEVLDMPIMVINTNSGRAISSKTEYAKATFSLLGCEEDLVIEEEAMEIRGRGNNSWGYPKKSYKFKLTKKDNLLNIAADDGRVWCLLANQCDMSLQRNHIAFEIGRYLDGIAWEPASTSVEVYLNGEYVGVYLLVEDIQISDERVDIDDMHKNEIDTGYLVEMSQYASGEVIYAHDRAYMIHNDLSSDSNIKRQQKDFIKQYIDDCYDALSSGDKELCDELMDLDSLVAVYMLEEIVKNLDSQWDSFNLHKDAGGKLVFGPVWDFDLSLGNADDGSDTYDDIFVGNGRGSGGGYNTWFAVAMMNDWFRQMVADKWVEIYDSLVLMPKFIVDEAELGFQSYKRNFERWEIFGKKQNRETRAITNLKNYTEHYEYLAEWTGKRISWINEAFTNENFVSEGEGVIMAQWARFRDESNNRNNNTYADDATEAMNDNYSSLTENIKLNTIKGPDGFGGEGVENLFDDQRDTKYCLSADGDIEVTFSLKQEAKVVAYMFRTANDTEENASRNPDAWTLYGSTDSKEWNEISRIDKGEEKILAVNHTWFGFEIENPTAYQYYKIVFENEGVFQLSEVRLLGEK